jgi:MoaA/NifB/PqqE/SkfB family radical SAM enzyme
MSSEIVELKQHFIENKRHPSCSDCWKHEDQGFKSVRQFYNEVYQDITLHNVVKNPDPPLLELELRSSTLCNFACRMCGPKDSSLIAKEIEDNPQITKFYTHVENKLEETSEENWQKLLKQTHSLRKLILTGGEPMLIKRYYELFDYLDANDLCKNIGLSMVTNTSVLNPKIVDRFGKFKKVKLALSIDGVEGTAEYQRFGTEWPVVRENVLTYARMFRDKSLYDENGELPCGVDSGELDELIINMTITAYSVLNFSKLADFLIEIYEIYPHAWFIAHHVNWPDMLTYNVLPIELKQRAINELTISIEKLSAWPTPTPTHATKFSGIIEDLSALVKQIQLDSDSTTQSTREKFIEFTKETDLIRGQSFEKTFGYKLY